MKNSKNLKLLKKIYWSIFYMKILIVLKQFFSSETELQK